MARPGTDPFALPAPDPEAERHAARVAAHLRAEIERAGGSLPFVRFMELALYAPGLGYYAAGARKLGAEGDFVTAPEISTLFPRCLARQVAEALAALGGGEVLEIGAGSGRMAAALLAELGALEALPARYLILETSPELRARQRETLGTARPAPVAWLEELPAPGFRGVMIANELLDALPAHRFVRTPGGVREWHVAVQGERFVWRTAAPAAALAEAVAGLEAALGAALAPGYVAEMPLAQRAWVAEAGRRLAAGWLLLIDYGYPRHEYYHPQRERGTLTCFYRHRAHSDPLILAGLQDISVHVEFSAVAEAAQAAGLELAGFTTQAEFLLAAGLPALLAGVDPQAAGYPALAREVKRLTLPGELGELVKVMGLARGTGVPLSGFSGTDMRGRL